MTFDALLRKLDPGLRNRPFSSWHPQRVREYMQVCRCEKLGVIPAAPNYRGRPRPPYKSCNWSICPKCGYPKRKKWTLDHIRMADALHCGVLHVTFKERKELEFYSLHNQRAFIRALFYAAKKSLFRVTRRDIGATIGLSLLYSTFGKGLIRAPHLHCLATAGGPNGAGGWSEYPEGEFASPDAVGRHFRDAYLESLLKENLRMPVNDPTEDRPRTPGEYRLVTPDEIRARIAAIPAEAWVPDVQSAPDGPARLVGYIGKHLSPFSPEPVYYLLNGIVIFPDRDDPTILYQLPADVFLSRVRQHVLPYKCRQFRDYGLFSPNAKAIFEAAVALRISRGTSVGAPAEDERPRTAESAASAETPEVTIVPPPRKEVPVTAPRGCCRLPRLTGNRVHRLVLSSALRVTRNSLSARGPPGTGARATRPPTAEEVVGPVTDRFLSHSLTAALPWPNQCR